jgi:hypothetical protein
MLKTAAGIVMAYLLWYKMYNAFYEKDKQASIPYDLILIDLRDDNGRGLYSSCTKRPYGGPGN